MLLAVAAVAAPDDGCCMKSGNRSSAGIDVAGRTRVGSTIARVDLRLVACLSLKKIFWNGACGDVAKSGGS